MISRDRVNIAVNTALNMLEELISVMEQASNNICNGLALEEINAGRYHLYVVSYGSQKAVACLWDSEDYLRIVESAASQAGIHLDETNHLEVQVPEAEFEANMITGGFEAWKGLSVDLRNDLLELLLDEISCQLKKRGLHVNCTPGEDVIFFIPV